MQGMGLAPLPRIQGERIHVSALDRTDPPPPALGHHSSSRERLLLVALVAGALGIRLIWLAAHHGPLGTESTYYARLGENLAAGRGWLGMREQGLQLFYPPLYPLLIAAATWVVHSGVIAGRVVSLLLGSLLVIPVWALARRMAGPRIACIAAVLAVIHPLLIATSTAVLSDTAYLCFAACGWVWGLRMIETDGWPWPILAGVSGGLAYLTRPEGLVFPVLLLALLAAGFVRGRIPLARRAALALGAFAATGAPYVIWLFTLTGQVHLETKSAENFEFARRIAAGLSPSQASHEIADDLTEVGLSMRPNVVNLETLRAPLKQRLRFFAETVRSYGPRILRSLASGPAFGAPITVALAFLGWFGVPWDRERRRHELYLFAWLGLALLPLLSLEHFSERFALSFLALLLVPMARGVDQVRRWAAATGTSDASPAARGVFTAVPWIAVAALVALSLRGLPDVLDLQPSDPQEVALASWIQAHAEGHERIVDAGPVVAYYAGAAVTSFPYASSETALRYLAKQGVGFIVLRGNQHVAPYVEDWISHGIPDSRATLAYRTTTASGAEIQIYRFRAGAS